MSKTFLNVIVTVISSVSFGQVSPPLAVSPGYDVQLRGYTPKVDIKLFDLQEISVRKIDTAYIIKHPAAWEPGFPNPCTWSDTLELYCFDTKGRITSHTYFLTGGNSSTKRYDSIGKIISRESYRRNGKDSGTRIYAEPVEDTTKYKTVVIKSRVGSDSVFTEIHFWEFKNGMDTAYIITKKTDRYGRLVEVRSHINKKNAREMDDDTGEFTYHYKNGYDSQGRLIYYLSFDYIKDEPTIEQRISYYDFGQITETRNPLTNKVYGRVVQIISESNGVVTISNNSNQVTLTPLDKESRLYKLKTVSSSGEFPYMEYYEISYH